MAALFLQSKYNSLQPDSTVDNDSERVDNAILGNTPVPKWPLVRLCVGWRGGSIGKSAKLKVQWAEVEPRQEH